jgi:hypothetical protein
MTQNDYIGMQNSANHELAGTAAAGDFRYN